MKCKIFVYDDRIERTEEEINDWLRNNPRIKIISMTQGSCAMSDTDGEEYSSTILTILYEPAS